MVVPELSVVIPAYNEEKRLGESLPRVLSYLRGRAARATPGAPGEDGGASTEGAVQVAEVVVVDDGSSDGTARVAREFEAHGVTVVAQPENRGKGAAVRRGIEVSRGRKVLLCDADLSTPIAEVERLEAHLADADVVIGSRAQPDSDVRERQPFYREMMGKTFNRILRLLGLGRFRDTQCGFKLLDGAVARDLAPDLEVDGFAFDVELLLLALERGYRVREVGVRWDNSPTSRVHPVIDSARMLWDIVRLRLRRRRR